MSNSPKSKKRIRRVALVGISAAVAMLLSYIEFLLPPIYAPIPAVKCGLANLAVLFILYKCGSIAALPVAAVKVLLTALLFGSFASFAYSASGAILSLAVMILMKRWDKFSPIGVSVAGAVAHNIGQVAAAVFITATPAVAAYILPLALTGTVAGVLVGALGGVLINRIP